MMITDIAEYAEKAKEQFSSLLAVLTKEGLTDKVKADARALDGNSTLLAFECDRELLKMELSRIATHSSLQERGKLYEKGGRLLPVTRIEEIIDQELGEGILKQKAVLQSKKQALVQITIFIRKYIQI